MLRLDPVPRSLLLGPLVTLLALAACSDSGTNAPTGDPGPGADVSGDTASDIEADPDTNEDEPREDVTPPEEDVDEDGSEDAAPEPQPDRQVIVVGGASDLPDRFAAGDLREGGPAVVYPADGTMMPININAPLFQWEGPSNDAYRFRLDGRGVGLEVYTSDWKWQPDAQAWEVFADRMGGEEITLQVARLQGGQVVEGPRSTMGLSRARVEGAIYYWAPSQAAIVRLEVGATRPEAVVPGNVFSCAGCHALSPDGSRIAYTRGAGTPIGNLGVIGTDSPPTVYQTERLSGYYPSFAPDNVRIAVSRNDRIVVIDTDTGRDEATLPMLEGTSAATHPAWSPSNAAVVFAAGAGGGFNPLGSLGISNAGLVRVPATGVGWGTPAWLVERGEAADPNENLFYPAYSPDGNWVVFNRAMAAVGAGSSPAGSELWLANDQRVIRPVFLQRAQGPPGTTNSWPKWAPATEDGRLWIAFTSNRPYGRMSTAASQIWIASVHPEEAYAGVDPSSAAYWMPGQELDVANHVAYWAPVYTKE